MAGVEVLEIHCKFLINRVDVPNFPFRWTINPYRGCRHACRYCYARPTHEFWGLDSGREFEQRIFANVNAPEVLREFQNPASITRKGVLVRRDVDVLKELSQVADAKVVFSVREHRRSDLEGDGTRRP